MTASHFYALFSAAEMKIKLTLDWARSTCNNEQSMAQTLLSRATSISGSLKGFPKNGLS